MAKPHLWIAFCDSRAPSIGTLLIRRVNTRTARIVGVRGGSQPAEAGDLTAREEMADPTDTGHNQAPIAGRTIPVLTG